MTADEAREFVRTHTVLCSPPIVPEVKLYLATELVPLWYATAAVLERYKLDSPFWAFAWPGGQAVARYILDHPELVRGKRVLDFATGSGLCAIAAAFAGARMVRASDTDSLAALVASINAEANGQHLEVTDHDLLGAELEDIDVVLAGDIFYEKPLAERGLAWFAKLSARGVRVLVGDPGRIYSPHAGLSERARYEVPTSLELEDRQVRVTSVLEAG